MPGSKGTKTEDAAPKIQSRMQSRFSKFKVQGLYLTLGLLGLWSCVTQKSRDEELSGLGKLYHNTTAKFNGYFNANEILEASIETLDQQHQDNFKQVLPVYEYAAASNPQAVAAELDRAIEKVSVVVNLHRKSHWTDDCYLLLGKAQYLKQDYEAAEETLRWMIHEFSPEKMARERQQAKEKSKKGKVEKPDEETATAAADAEDDGLADVTEMTEREKRRYYKELERERKAYNREVRRNRRRRSRGKKTEKAAEPAPETAVPAPATPQPQPADTLVTNENGLISLNDKDDGVQPDPDSYFLKHRPAYHEGVLWLARTFIQRKRFEEALRYIAQLEGDPYTFPDVRDELPITRAHLLLARKEYEAAVPYLERAIDLAPKRSDRARYAFILAQLHHRAGREQQALATFEEALRYGPTYEMRFNGSLYIVENAWRTGRLSTPEARQELLRMARDFKNEEFRDQIFYALATIELEAGNRAAGIEYLQASLAESRSNTLQRAESYLRLANLFLLEENFVSAQAYFDSTRQVLPASDERYPEVENWAESLKGIAENLQIIERQDSLLRIAALSPADQQALAFEIKKERDRQRLNAITRQAAANTSGGGGQGSPGPNNLRQVNLGGNAGSQGKTNSAFFAYDDRSVKRGQREFQQRWGTRPLEDDWRRQNKQALAEFAAKGDDEVEAVVALPEDEINSILAEVPQTPEAIAEAEGVLQEALFDLGILYRQELDDKKRAIETLERLDRRFQDYPREAETLYYLYLNYSDLGQTAKAQEVASRIFARHPSSVYAKVLQNPGYAAEVANEERRLNQYYEGAYEAFSKSRYQEAFAKCEAATRQFGPENPLQPKFALLMAMASGHLEGKETYVANLHDLIARFPGTEEQTRAREILRLLGEQPAAIPGVTPEDISRYQTNDEQIHYILIVFHDNVRLDQPQIQLSNYNLKYHKLDRLRINNLYLGNDQEQRLPMLIVRRFKDKAEAMKYYEGATRNTSEFIDPAQDYSLFAVNQENYREILRSRSISGYEAFFNQNYLQ